VTQPLRIIFAGTPDFAARHLQALINSEHQIVGVYSNQIVQRVAEKN